MIEVVTISRITTKQRYRLRMLSVLKKIIKTLAAGIFYYGGLFHLSRFINNRSGRRLTILAYHRVTKKKIEDITTSLPTLFVTEKTFIRQLEFIKKHYRVLTFSELRLYIQNGGLPSNSMIITFDDGYEDNYLNAYPIMSSMNIPSAMFLASNKIGQPDDSFYWWDRIFYYFQDSKWYVEGVYPKIDREVQQLLDEFKNNMPKLFSRLDKIDTRLINRLLNTIKEAYKISEEPLKNENKVMQWEQVQRMRGVEIGSHSCNHYNLITLDQETLAAEISMSSKSITSNSGYKVNTFAYPGGNYNAIVKKTTAAEYEFSVTTDIGINDLNDTAMLKRICVWEGTSRGINGTFSKSLFAFKLLGN